MRKGWLRHGHTSGGPSPTWVTWKSMRDRCHDPKSVSYKHYGARGITVCDRWRQSFENFLADMGERPADKTLDRIDCEGHYTPENCRWADRFEQRINNRNIHWIEYCGERFPMLHLARKVGVPYSVLAKRVEAGWPADRLGEPVRQNVPVTYGGEETNVAALARKLGLTRATLRRRILAGLPEERWSEPCTR